MSSSRETRTGVLCALSVQLLVAPFIFPSAGWAETSLDLSSTSANLSAQNKSPVAIQIGGALNKGTVTGGTPMTVSPGQLVTPSQYVAAFEVAKGNQTLLLNTQGAAAGGSLNLNSGYVQNLASLTVPAGVSVNAIGYNAGTPLNVTGNVNILGSVFSLQNAANIMSVLNMGNLNIASSGLLSGQLPAGAELSGLFSSAGMQLNVAGNIVNQGTITTPGTLNIAAAGSITNSSANNVRAVMSAQSINLLTGAGSIVNSGLIQATNSLNLNTLQPTTDLVIDNRIGMLEAVNGVINVREDGVNIESANAGIWGGSLRAPDGINMFGKIMIAKVDQIEGALSNTGSIAHVQVEKGTLTLGNQILSGDPTYYNTGSVSGGDITIGSLTSVSGDLAIVAAGNIFTTGSTTIQASFDNSIFLSAGYNFTASPSDNSIGSFGDDNPGNTTDTITFDGTSTAGKNVNPSGFDLNLTALGTGSITVVATGEVDFAGGFVATDFGNILILAEGNINQTSGIGAFSTFSGDITIRNASAGSMSGLQITNGTPTYLPTIGAFSSGANIIAAGLLTTGGNIDIRSNGSVTTDSIVTENFFGGNGGSIFIVGNDGINTGALSAKAGPGGTGGDISLTSNNGIFVAGDIDTRAAGGGGTSGKISVFELSSVGLMRIDGTVDASCAGCSAGDVQLFENMGTNAWIFNSATTGSNTVAGTVSGNQVNITTQGTGAITFEGNAPVAVKAAGDVKVQAGLTSVNTGTILGAGDGTLANSSGALEAGLSVILTAISASGSGNIGDTSNQVVISSAGTTTVNSEGGNGNVFITDISAGNTYVDFINVGGFSQFEYNKVNGGNIDIGGGFKGNKINLSISGGSGSILNSFGESLEAPNISLSTSDGSIGTALNKITTVGTNKLTALAGGGDVFISNNNQLSLFGTNGAGAGKTFSIFNSGVSNSIIDIDGTISAGIVNLETDSFGAIRFGAGSSITSTTGSVTLKTKNENISVNVVGAAIDINAANGVTIELGNGNINPSPPGTSVQIIAQNGDIDLKGAGADNAKIQTVGGNVTLKALNGSITNVGMIDTNAFDSSAAGGDIDLLASKDISTGELDTRGTTDFGGAITVAAKGEILIDGPVTALNNGAGPGKPIQIGTITHTPSSIQINGGVSALDSGPAGDVQIHVDSTSELAVNSNSAAKMNIRNAVKGDHVSITNKSGYVSLHGSTAVLGTSSIAIEAKDIIADGPVNGILEAPSVSLKGDNIGLVWNITVSKTTDLNIDVTSSTGQAIIRNENTTDVTLSLPSLGSLFIYQSTQAGDILLPAAITMSSGGFLSITAANGNISSSGSKTDIITNNTPGQGGFVDLEANNGSINIGNGSITTSGNGADQSAGLVSLTADKSIKTGSITALATGTVDNDGNVNLTAPDIHVAGSIDVSAPTGNGGDVNLDARKSPGGIRVDGDIKSHSSSGFGSSFTMLDDSDSALDFNTGVAAANTIKGTISGFNNATILNTGTGTITFGNGSAKAISVAGTVTVVSGKDGVATGNIFGTGDGSSSNVNGVLEANTVYLQAFSDGSSSSSVGGATSQLITSTKNISALNKGLSGDAYITDIGTESVNVNFDVGRNFLLKKINGGDTIFNSGATSANGGTINISISGGAGGIAAFSKLTSAGGAIRLSTSNGSIGAFGTLNTSTSDLTASAGGSTSFVNIQNDSALKLSGINTAGSSFKLVNTSGSLQIDGNINAGEIDLQTQKAFDGMTFGPSVLPLLFSNNGPIHLTTNAGDLASAGGSIFLNSAGAVRLFNVGKIDMTSAPGTSVVMLAQGGDVNLGAGLVTNVSIATKAGSVQLVSSDDSVLGVGAIKTSLSSNPGAVTIAAGGGDIEIVGSIDASSSQGGSSSGGQISISALGGGSFRMVGSITNVTNGTGTDGNIVLRQTNTLVPLTLNGTIIAPQTLAGTISSSSDVLVAANGVILDNGFTPDAITTTGELTINAGTGSITAGIAASLKAPEVGLLAATGIGTFTPNRAIVINSPTSTVLLASQTAGADTQIVVFGDVIVSSIVVDGTTVDGITSGTKALISANSIDTGTKIITSPTLTIEGINGSVTANTVSSNLTVFAKGGVLGNASVDVTNTGNLSSFKVSGIGTNGSLRLSNSGSLTLSNSFNAAAGIDISASSIIMGNFGFATNNNDISLTTDSISTGGIGSINAGTGKVTFSTLTPTVPINLVSGGSGLLLSNTRLGSTTAKTVEIGPSASITLGADFDISSKYNLSLEGGSGPISTLGQTLTLGSKTLTVNTSGAVTLGPVSSTGTSITITGGSVSLDGATGNASDVTSITSTAGGISTSATGVVNSSNLLLSATGGAIALTTAVSPTLNISSTGSGSDINITNTGVLTALGVSSVGTGESFSLKNTGSVTLASALHADSGVSLALGAGDVLANAGFLISSNSQISIVTDGYSMTGAKQLDGGNVLITPATNTLAINLGGAGGGLNITEAQLNAIEGTDVVIGSTNGTGAIAVTSDINLTPIYDLLIRGGTTSFTSTGKNITIAGFSFDLQLVSGDISVGAISSTADGGEVKLVTDSPTTQSTITLNAGVPSAHSISLLTGAGKIVGLPSSINPLLTTAGDGGSVFLSALTLPSLSINAAGTTGNGGTISYDIRSAANFNPLIGDISFDVSGVSAGKVSISTGGNFTFDPAANMIKANTTKDGAQISLTAGSVGLGNLFVSGNLAADGVGANGNGGKITLSSNSKTAFAINATGTNAIKGTLSVSGAGTGKDGELTVINNAGGIKNSVQTITDVSKVTFNASSSAAGAITIGKPIGSAGTSLILLNAGGTGTITTGTNVLQASNVRLASGTGAITANTNAGIVEGDTAGTGAVKIISKSTSALSIAPSSAGSSFTVEHAGDIITSNITAGTTIALTTKAVDSDITISGNLTATNTSSGAIKLTTSGKGAIDFTTSPVLQAKTVTLTTGSGNIGSGLVIGTALPVRATSIALNTTGAVNINNLGLNTSTLTVTSAKTDNNPFTLFSANPVVITLSLAKASSVLIDTSGGSGGIKVTGALGNTTSTTSITLVTDSGYRWRHA